jgi:hypothetical protein
MEKGDKIESKYLYRFTDHSAAVDRLQQRPGDDCSTDNAGSTAGDNERHFDSDDQGDHLGHRPHVYAAAIRHGECDTH